MTVYNVITMANAIVDRIIMSYLIVPLFGDVRKGRQINSCAPVILNNTQKSYLSQEFSFKPSKVDYIVGTLHVSNLRLVVSLENGIVNIR